MDNIEKILIEILEELKNISEYVDYKKQKEMWDRKLAKNLPNDELMIDKEKEFINIDKDYVRNPGQCKVTFR